MKQQLPLHDVLIIGGGLAGLSCAIHLTKYRKQVLLIEKNNYPKHKVCGEYISNEVLPYLNFLEINPFDAGAVAIDKFELSTTNNSLITADLPLGGFGISRYTLDYLLANKAKEQGAIIKQDTITNVNFLETHFEVTTKNNQKFTAKVVIGAFGKRSSLDLKLQRKFIKKKSPYLAVKTHVKGNFQDNLVGLHNFKGGYCGVSKVENNTINLCYITNFSSFKKYKNVTAFQERVVYKNQFLKELFDKATPVFNEPLTISQISFETKKPVEKHILMCGDAAGMIHPLCGNGMGMAIQSAQIASRLVLQYVNGAISSRKELEKNYIRQWNKQFKYRLKAGNIIAFLFRQHKIAEILLFLLKKIPFLLPKIIKQTHGKPIKL